MHIETAKNINTLGRFCGQRDVESLDRNNLFERFGIEHADVMVLFGGSIIAGGDVLAEAIRGRIASTYIIVGGAGHTTETLRQTVQSEYPSIRTAGLTEAEIFQKYLQEIYGCEADFLETRSTNCGNNITYLLDLMEGNLSDYLELTDTPSAGTTQRTLWNMRDAEAVIHWLDSLPDELDLSIGGPRASECLNAYEATRTLLIAVLSKIG